MEGNDAFFAIITLSRCSNRYVYIEFYFSISLENDGPFISSLRVCVCTAYIPLSLYGLIRFVLNPWNRDLSDKQYSYVVEKQPLGRRLFEDYCREQLHYKNWIEFLEMVNQYELSISDKKQIADKIRKEFLAPDALR